MIDPTNSLASPYCHVGCMKRQRNAPSALAARADGANRPAPALPTPSRLQPLASLERIMLGDQVAGGDFDEFRLVLLGVRVVDQS